MKELLLKVEGMMCEGCENRVKNALMDIEGVQNVIASHKEKNVKVILKEDISESIIKEAIEDLGYDVK
ncbi:MAG: heavy-metal-associated domain-containing protein [Clostridia bacterium]|nr:heavy-metal-associated domain-containing protein [Clostridia bacterium]